jgi:hypothetical protein
MKLKEKKWNLPKTIFKNSYIWWESWRILENWKGIIENN